MVPGCRAVPRPVPRAAARLLLAASAAELARAAGVPVIEVASVGHADSYAGLNRPPLAVARVFVREGFPAGKEGFSGLAFSRPVSSLEYEQSKRLRVVADLFRSPRRSRGRRRCATPG